MNKTIKFLSTCSVLAIAIATGTAFSATTKTSAARPSIASTVSRPKVAGGASTTRTPTVTTPKVNATPTPTVTEPEPEPEPERVIVVDNKTSQFDDILSDIAGVTPDSSASDLAERVRQQRALLDGASKTLADSDGVKMGANACDAGLRKCMSEKCGNDFTKCANDSTAIWGDKMDSCRRTTNCSGHEYNLLAPEIMADRDMNVRMSYYNSVLNCGNRYNSCIFNECGKYMDKCLAKSDGDRAIAKCESIARECREQDNGLASRVMSVFGGLRTIATDQVKKDEARLYELRDLMRAQCERLGAMFDERTLDCVYTVNFFAGDDTETPKASKKLYAGDTFQCNANWFGVDVTTFKENAYRLTRAQTSASAGAMGAGVGTAAGLISSGAIDRAIATQRAEVALNEAKCTESGGTWTGKKCENTTENKSNFKNQSTAELNKPNTQKQTRAPQEAMQQVLQETGANEKIQNADECDVTYNSKNLCDQHSDKCTWTDTGCIAAVATAVSSQEVVDADNEDEDNKSSSSTFVPNSSDTNKNALNSACDIKSIVNNMKIDTPVDISGCSDSDIQKLKDACNDRTRFPYKMVLLSNNKQAQGEQTTPVVESGSFTCKAERNGPVHPYTSDTKTDAKNDSPITLFAKNPVTKWKVEQAPDTNKCTSTCANISEAQTSQQRLSNPECLEICAPTIQKSCEKLNKDAHYVLTDTGLLYHCQ